MFSNRDMEERKKIPAKFCREGVQSALNLPAGAEKLCWKTENGAEKREEEEKADMKCLKLLSALGAAVKNETGDVREKAARAVGCIGLTVVLGFIWSPPSAAGAAQVPRETALLTADLKTGEISTASPQNALFQEERDMGPVEEGAEFSEFLKKARQCESLITGEKAESVPDTRFIVSGQEENDSRVISIAAQIEEGKEAAFYVFGRNFSPNGTALAEWFGEGTVYSNCEEAELRTGKDVWHIARMSVLRGTDREDSGGDNWELRWKTEASCLSRGTALYVGRRTGQERKIYTAPLGHRDENGDSVCDRCRTRAFYQEAGSKIRVSLGGRELTFTCIDEDYREYVPELRDGGMLYLSDQALEAEWFGGYGATEYRDSQVRKYFRDGIQNGISLQGSLVGIEIPENGETDYAMSLSREEYLKYRERISGEAFLLRDSGEGKVWGAGLDGSLKLVDPDGSDYGIRPAIVLKKPDAGRTERIHWETGDLQECELQGGKYLFSCVDRNYTGGQTGEAGALFLCTAVIPANYGSDYVLEEQADGSHAYVFQPGPLVNFGDSSDYKYSRVRKWLDEAGQELYLAKTVQVGNDTAYMGETPEGEFGDFRSNSIAPYSIGDQKLSGKLFLLSVDEALKYRDFLWKFQGESRDNPESQISAFSKGYWLRSPMGDGKNPDTGFVYGVDLERGNIHPQRVKPEGGTGDEELDVTAAFGVRPAFVMPQD